MGRTNSGGTADAGDAGLTRVSGAERQTAAERLRLAHDEGRLTLTEYDDRVREAYAARTRAELDVLFTDLPTVRERPLPGAAERERAVQKAEARSAHLGEWRSWAGTAVLLIGIWAVISLAVGEAIFFWPMFPIGIWGLVLISQMITGRGDG